MNPGIVVAGIVAVTALATFAIEKFAKKPDNDTAAQPNDAPPDNAETVTQHRAANGQFTATRPTQEDLDGK